MDAMWPCFYVYPTVRDVPHLQNSISAYETLRIILIPSFSLWGKLGSLFKESLYARVHETIVMQQKAANLCADIANPYTENPIHRNYYRRSKQFFRKWREFWYCIQYPTAFCARDTNLWPVTTLYSLRKCSKLLVVMCGRKGVTKFHLQ